MATLSVNEPNQPIRQVLGGTKRKAARWTEEQKNLLRSMWPLNTADEVAKVFGLHSKTIRNYARYLGLPEHRRGPAIESKIWPAEKIELLRKLWESGVTASAIADQLGKKKNAVIGKIFRLKIKGPYSRNHSPSRGERKGRHKAGGSGKVRFDGIVRLRINRIPYDAVPIIDAEIPLEQRKTLMQLGKCDCRWPVGNVGEPGFFFCGAGVGVTKGPYCASHAMRAFNFDAPSRLNTSYMARR